MNTPLLSPPACLALGLSLTMHVLLGGFGWGAFSPQAPTRARGIPLPAYTVQVRLVAPQSAPGNPLARAANGQPDVVSASAQARAATLRGPELAAALKAATADAGMIVTPAPAQQAPQTISLDTVSPVPAVTAATAAPTPPAPAGDAEADVSAKSATLLPQASNGDADAASAAAPDEALPMLAPALAARAPAPQPQDLALLTPPPLPPESLGATKPVAAPEQALLDSAYYPTRQLTVRPAPTTDPTLKLPPNWIEAFGRTILTIYVNADGSVQQVVLRSTTLPQALHQNVVDAFRTLTFTPGEIDGRRVPSYMSIEANVSMLLGRH